MECEVRKHQRLVEAPLGVVVVYALLHVLSILLNVRNILNIETSVFRTTRNIPSPMLRGITKHLEAHQQRTSALSITINTLFLVTKLINLKAQKPGEGSFSMYQPPANTFAPQEQPTFAPPPIARSDLPVDQPVQGEGHVEMSIGSIVEGPTSHGAESGRGKEPEAQQHDPQIDAKGAALEREHSDV